MPNPLDALLLLLKLFALFLTISFLINLAFTLKAISQKSYRLKMNFTPKRIDSEAYQRYERKESDSLKVKKKPSVALKSTIVSQNKQSGKAKKRISR